MCVCLSIRSSWISVIIKLQDCELRHALGLLQLCLLQSPQQALFSPHKTHSSKKDVFLYAGRIIQQNGRLIFRLLLFLTWLLKTKPEELPFHDPVSVFFFSSFPPGNGMALFCQGVYPQAVWLGRQISSEKCCGLPQLFGPRSAPENGHLSGCDISQSCSETPYCQWLDPSFFRTRVMSVFY